MKEMEWPDDDLIENIMKSLGIHDIVEFEFCLKNRIQRERNAAIKMLEKYFDDLTNSDHTKWAEAKDTLKQIYYKVEQMDEEGFL